MNFDDGASYTHFCYAKSSKKGNYSFSHVPKIFGAENFGAENFGAENFGAEIFEVRGLRLID